MLRLLRRGALALSAVTLCFVFGASPASSDVGLQNVNLACNDGTNLNAALDTTALTTLTNAVNAMALYPAGNPPLTCNVSQTDPSSTSSDPNDFAVGGGQFTYPPQGTMCEVNFGLSAHAPDTDLGPMPASGTLNESMPGNGNCTAGQGDLVTKVDCLQVIGSTAYMTSTVQRATGFWTGNAPGGELAWKVTDNPDTIQGNGGATGPCDFTPAASQPSFPLYHGNISVHDNEN